MPAAVRVVLTLPPLNATLTPGGRNRGNLAGSWQALRCPSIASHPSGPATFQYADDACSGDAGLNVETERLEMGGHDAGRSDFPI